MSEFRRRMLFGWEGEPHLPAGYTRLEYIKSEGDYIDTGQKIQFGDVVELDILMKSRATNTIYFGYRRAGTGSDPYSFMGGIGLQYARAMNLYYQLSDKTAHHDYCQPPDLKRLLRFETGATNYTYVDGVLSSYGTTQGTGAFDSNGSSVFNYTIFTFNNQGTPNTSLVAIGSKCWGYRIIRNNGKACELIPAKRDIDQIVGLYDVINNDFRTAPNNINFSSNLDEVIPLYSIEAYYGEKGGYYYTVTSDGHVGCKLGNTGAAYLWLQDASENASSPGSSNINDKSKIFELTQGDSVVLKVKNITKMGSGNISVGLKATDNSTILETGNFSDTSNKSVTTTITSDIDASGIFLYWASQTSRAFALDVELWVNNVRYI